MAMPDDRMRLVEQRRSFGDDAKEQLESPPPFVGVPTSSAGSKPPMRSKRRRRNAMLAPVPNFPVPTCLSAEATGDCGAT